MSKPTENLVLFAANGTQVFYVKEAAPEAPLPGKKQKMNAFFRDANGTDHQRKDLTKPNIKTVEGALLYLKGHNALTCPERSGYDFYYNAEGPTNNQTPRRVTVEGKTRNILVFMQGLYMDIAKGGQTAEDARACLNTIVGYMAVAEAEVQKTLADAAKTELLNKAAALNIPADELEAFLAARANRKPVVTTVIPNATVTPDEAEDADEEIDEDETDGEPEEVEETENAAQ